ncbi:MAG TPA: Ig-like domain-containing protein [Thermoanaerobaculia bacterium]|nr:Ig-like domain-containing protein [Thermoanaerobaculia bacterium]
MVRIHGSHDCREGSLGAARGNDGSTPRSIDPSAAAVLGFLLGGLLSASLGAQQVHQNVNVLPIAPQFSNAPCLLDLDGEIGPDLVYGADGAISPFEAADAGLPGCVENPDWYLEGDGFANRQVEPTIAVSTRNPNHLIAFFNDYRAVDLPDPAPGGLAEKSEDEGSAEEGSSRLARASGKSETDEEPTPVAASEAFIGVAFSYDNGISWSGGFVPGGPEDFSPASLASPLHGLTAATDPIAVAAPCGFVHLVGIAFDRGGESRMFFASYQDTNDSESDHTWRYLGTSVIDSGNNAEHGVFLDKPDAAVDILRGSADPDPCAHRLYVSYTTFNGQDRNGKIQSKLNFGSAVLGSTIAQSYPSGGVPVAVSFVNMPFKQGQGTAIAIDPRPTAQGGGAIYLFWRNFFDPHAILMLQSTDFGASFPGKPKELTKELPLANFDQPSIPSTATATPVDDVAFRSNGFPTAAVTADGTVYAAWQEKVDVGSAPGSPAFGRPDPNGSPRIVVVRSKNGGNTWTDVDGDAGTRRAVDFGDRDVGCGPPRGPSCTVPAGFGFLPQERPSGPQVMPKLRFGGGRLLMTYYESRGLADYASDTIAEVDLGGIGFISGIRRLLDLRAAVLDPASGHLLSTTQVSRYSLSADSDPTEETLADVTPTCTFDGASCVPAVHRANAPQSGSGQIPFIGDYNGLVPGVDFVSEGGAWRWATAASDVPDRSFRAVWADNRHLAEPAGGIFAFQDYGPPGIGGPCVNPGSRNTDVLTARVDAAVLLDTPVTYRALESQPRTFPFSLTNALDGTRLYRIELAAGAELASLRPFEYAFGDVDAENLALLPYSTVSRVVYVDPLLAGGAPGPIRLEVYTLDCAIDPLDPPTDPDFSCPVGELVGSVTFNADPTNPTGGSGETANPLVSNPLVSNPLVSNPLVSNPLVSNLSASNPLVSNPLVSNPLVSNASPEDVIDVTWTVSSGPGSDTISSLLPVINIDNAEQFVANYDFQLILYRTSSFAALNAAACATYASAQDQIVSVVSTNPEATPLVSNPLVSNPLVSNPLVSNPLISNPLVSNPLVSNPLVSNSAITVAPSDAASAATTGRVAASSTHEPDLRAPRRPDVVNVLLRAVKRAPDEELGDFVYDPVADPPALTLVPFDCDPQAEGAPCFVTNAPDLEPGPVLPLDEPVAPGSSFLFPPLQGDLDGDGTDDAWQLFNHGVNDATAENRPLRHGFYLSRDETLDLLPSGEPVPCTAGEIEGFDCDTLIGATASSGNSLGGQQSEAFGQATLTLPGDLPPGDYHLILWVDDLEEVSEFDELNNYRTLEAIVPLGVVVPNRPPLAPDATLPGSGEAELLEDEALTGTLPGSDPDNDPLIWAVVTPPASGSFELDPATGAFTYTPEADFNGVDSVVYSVTDDEGESDQGTVSFTVAAVDDPPLATGGITLEVQEDQTVTGILSAEDVDGGASFSFAIEEQGVLGTATIGDPVTCPAELAPSFLCVEVSYAPSANSNGQDQFTFLVTDLVSGATSEVTVVVVVIGAEPDAPVAVDSAVSTAEDTSVTLVLAANDPDGAADEATFSFQIQTAPSSGLLGALGAVERSGPTFTTSVDYTPTADFAGTDALTFTANDGTTSSNVATVTIEVTAVNDDPVAVPDVFSVGENSGPVDLDVVLNDLDPDGDAVALTGVTPDGDIVDATTGAVLARVVRKDARLVTFTPGVNVVGPVEFAYGITDGRGGSASGTATVEILDMAPDRCFVGLLDPWKEQPVYTAKIGSAVPLVWFYGGEGPSACVAQASADMMPEVRVRGPFACSGDEGPDTLTQVFSPGNSGFQYDSSTFVHQFNWQTSLSEPGCYNVRVFSEATRQLDRPQGFRIRLRR